MYNVVKSLNLKYYKKYPYALTQEMSFVWFSLFWSKKYTFKSELNILLNFMLINFLVQYIHFAHTCDI